MTDAFQPHPYFERHVNAPCAVEPIMSDPKMAPPASSGPRDAEQAAAYARGFVAEPEGHDDHLDAIERRLVPYLAADREAVTVTGLVTRSSHRVAFVPKG